MCREEKILQFSFLGSVEQPEVEFVDFYEAFHYLQDHPMVESSDVKFSRCLDIMVVKIDPNINAIDLVDSIKNTKTQIWLEFGPWDPIEKAPMHDIRLDCGGDTFEEAVIQLANRVRQYY